MKKNEKRMILVVILIAIVVISAIYLSRKGGKKQPEVAKVDNEVVEENKVVEEFVQVLDDGTKLNTSTKLHESKVVDGLEVGNIQLTHINGISVVLADVVNNTSAPTEITQVILTLYDKEGNKLVAIPGIIDELAPGASSQLNMGVTADYANAYDFTIEKK